MPKVRPNRKRMVTRVRFDVGMTLPAGMTPKSAQELLVKRIETKCEVSEPHFASLTVRLAARSTEYLPPLNQEP